MTGYFALNYWDSKFLISPVTNIYSNQAHPHTQMMELAISSYRCWKLVGCLHDFGSLW